MLRRLEPTSSYRSLSKGFWPGGLPLGRRSVIYGHNGSGKSSFASLLLEIASEAASTGVLWQDEHCQNHTLAVGQGGPSPAMAVFTKEWVRRNLSQFLDGATASPIVTLGEEAIEAKEQEVELGKRIEELRSEAGDAGKKQRDFDAKADKLAKEVQDAIADQLREFDYLRFSKNRNSVPVMKGKLHDYKGEFPDENEHAEALKRLVDGEAQRVADIADPPQAPAALLESLPLALSETPTRVALEALAVDQVRQTWVEKGLDLHEHLNECLFCGGGFSDERRRRLAKHFDKSWYEIRERTQTLLAGVQRARSNLSGWLDAIPTPKDLSSELRDGYALHVQAAQDHVAARLEVLGEVESALRAKSEDPSVAPNAPDMTVLKVALSAATLQQAASEHNRQADKHTELVEGRYETILNHLIGSRSHAFRSLTAQAQAAGLEAKAAREGAELAERTLGTLRQQQFTNSQMAHTLTNDLARVYGKDHLVVAVTKDGKSYACLRGDAPATHLSDGERTTLSLLYFLRKLEDESVTGDMTQRIVVIDDPSSSLDREALFATHQWLVDTLGDFGQFIVLTHDFGLLRLFLKSQASAWGKSRNKISRGDIEEARFPSVSFLEMYTANRDDVRRTQVAALPPMLVKHTTEYAYLFSKVMEGVEGGANHDRLFLLPNAARRVLEVFTSYKAPHLGTFAQRLEDLMGGDLTNNPHRDVYDFCNRYSHGEGSESVDILDARVVHRQIRRCMEFLKSADTEHFERMCKATDVDATAFA